MPNVAPTSDDGRGWFLPGLLIALALTAFRVALLAFNRTDLFVDEAQYWLWGQELAFGYYSKPPLIAWVIRAATELGGSDAPFWVRLPAPLLHGVTALLLGALTAPRFGRVAAVWVVAGWISLPMVTAGSLLVSTDTVMVPFLVLGLMAWLQGLARGGSAGWAAMAGFAVGLGFLAKYAAVYYLLCAALAALLLPQARTGWRPALAGLAAFLVAISPNVWWNLQHGLSTLEHTLDNADWVRDPGDRAGLNLASLAEFLAAQLVVFGPVLFPALVGLAIAWHRQEARLRLLLVFALPVLALVSLQALLDQAYPNWAAAAYVAGIVAVTVHLLARNRRWLRISLGLNLAIALLLPLATVVGTGWRLGAEGPLVFERYLGRSAMSGEILAAARAAGVTAVVASDRDLLADLTYAGRDQPIAIYAQPHAGRPRNHYELTRSLPAGRDGPVLLVTSRDHPVDRCTPEPVGRLAPEAGAYREKPQNLFLLPAGCLALDAD